jgi:hypothetical protein
LYRMSPSIRNDAGYVNSHCRSFNVCAAAIPL